MRTLKVSIVMALALALMSTSAFAGPGCGASKEAKSASSESACISTVFAGANNSCSTSKAKLAELIEIESTRLPSGTLVVMYKGKTEDTVAYLQASTSGAVDNFCCPLTRTMAANKDCKVEVAKIAQGAMIVVSAEKKELIDEFEHSFMTLASSK